MITPLHKLWRLFPPQKRRYFLSKTGGILAPSLSSSLHSSPEIIVAGEFSRASGLGEGARIMVQALKGRNVPVHALDVSPYHFSLVHYHKAARLLSQYPHAAIIFHINAPQLPFILLTLPRKLLRNRKIIGYWAWELPVLPQEWKVGFQLVHEIWVPSHFVASAVKEWAELYQKPVRVIPHPIASCKEPHYEHISKADLNIPENKTIILTSFSLASSFERKNPIGNILAFKKASKFMQKADMHLIVKVTHPENYPEDMNKIMNAIGDDKTISLNTRLLSSAENRAFLSFSDIILSLHRSEGFGLVPAEAMKLGKVVIATDWSATHEFVKKNCGVPIDYTLIPVKDSRMVYQIENACWANPDLDMAAHAICDLSADKKLSIKLGYVAKRMIQEKFNSDILIDAIIKNKIINNDGIDEEEIT